MELGDNDGEGDVPENFNDAKQSFDENDAGVPEDTATARHAEPRTVIVKGLSKMTTLDTIRYFFECKTRENVLGVAKFGEKSALVTLENISDFSETKRRVEEKTLDNKQLTIVNCPLGSTILVSGLTPDTTADALKYRFSVPAVGGNVSHVLLHGNKSQAIVTFEDSTVIKKVIESDWELNNAVLKVDTYYAFLERTIEHDQDPVGLASTEAQSGSNRFYSDYGHKLREFLNKGSVFSETFICQHKGFIRYILEHCKDELEDLKIQLKPYCVEIEALKADEEAARADDKILISGTEEGLGCVRKALHRMISPLTVEEITVHQPGLNKLFSSGKGESLVEAIKQEFHCSIEHKLLPGIPENDQEDLESREDSFSGESEDQLERIASPPRLFVSSADFTKISCYNVDITWKTGNIVQENADILVSSNIGKLYNEFRSAVGQKLLPSEDSIEVGGTSITPGYNLPCKYIIYTRCPRWDGTNGPAEMALRFIVQECLQEALQRNATSIAFPIIGTGGLGFDKYTACRIMITEVISVTCGWGLTSLTDIRFVVYDKDKGLANAFQYEFLEVSGLSYLDAGGAVVLLRPNYTVAFGWPLGYGYKVYRSLTQPVPYNIPFPFARGSTTNMYGNVEVHVLHGDPNKFVYEKSDAIVNISNTPRYNKLTKNIRRAAGTALRDEWENLSHQTPGSALVTKSGSLNAQRIIHMIIGLNPDVKTIQNSIEQCLNVADENGCQFISIPFDVKDFNLKDGELAQNTFKTLSSVCRSLQNLRRIRMVVFDEENVLVFQQMQQYYGSGVVSRPNESIPPGTSPRWPSSDATASKVTFQLFGENSSLENAKSALEKGISESYEVRQIEGEYVANLNEKQKHMLTAMARKLDVTITPGAEPHVLVIQGDREDIDAIDSTLKEEIDEMSQTLYNTVRWQYQFHDNDAQYFERKSNSTLEKASSSEESRATVRIEGKTFDIDLQTSSGIGQATGRQISIKRTTLEGFPIPAKWCPMPLEDGKEKTVHLVTISPGSHEYQKVLKIFGSSGDPRFPAYFELPKLFLQSCHHIKIQRIQNPHLYQQYMAYKKKMDNDNGRKFNERRLFHGTIEENIRAINIQGFNRTFCGANGTLLGKGVYFAESAMYSAAFTSPNQNNERHIYLARVLTGHYREGDRRMKVPPPKYHGRTEVLYDSVANTDGPNPDIFAVFHDAQCYPEYLITFQY